MVRKQFIARIIIKKKTVLVTCPVFTYGSSTGLAPIHVRISRIARIDHSFSFLVGLNFVVLIDFFVIIGIINTRIDVTRADTPPSFDGMARRIAYANRKYHSG